MNAHALEANLANAIDAALQTDPIILATELRNLEDETERLISDRRKIDDRLRELAEEKAAKQARMIAMMGAV